MAGTTTRREKIEKMDFLGATLTVLSIFGFLILVLVIFELLPKSIFLLAVVAVIWVVILCLAYKIFCLIQDLSAGQPVVNGYSLAAIIRIIIRLRRSASCREKYLEMIRDEGAAMKFDTGYAPGEISDAPAGANVKFPDDVQSDLDHLAKWLSVPARKHYAYEELMALFNLAEAEVKRHTA